MKQKNPKRRRNVLLGCLGAFLLVFGFLGIFYGPVIRDLMSNGLLQSLLGGQNMRKYSGTSMDNLKALHTAMMLYHDSEEMFPEASGWMDAIQPRIKTNDMTMEEATKKLHDPTIGAKGDVYGYAMNDAVSRKYKSDLKDPATTPLLFDSSDTGRNAHGDPKKLAPKPARPGGNIGVAVDGHALKF